MSGQTDPYQAFLKTWQKDFEPKTAKLPRFPYSELYYYKPGSTFQDNIVDDQTGKKKTLAGFYRTHTGHCENWVNFLWTVTGKLNKFDGMEVKKTLVKPLGFHFFLVKKWWDKRPDKFGMNEWLFRFGGGKEDMVRPQPPDNMFGQAKNDITGVPGQNSIEGPIYNCPSQKVFTAHWLFHVVSIADPSKDKYYDPSYGQVYDNQQKFEEVLFAVGIRKEIEERTGKAIIALYDEHQLFHGSPVPHPWVYFEDYPFQPGDAH